MLTTLQQRIVDGSCPEPNSGCSLWMGTVDKDGYGKIGVGSGSGYLQRAHRVSYEAFIGPIPPGRWVLHHCDTPCCVNPRHLFLGNAKINAEDRARKGRNCDQRGEKNSMYGKGYLSRIYGKGYLQMGEKNGNARLTWDDIPLIRLFAAAGACQRLIAERFGVVQQSVSNVLTGKIWSESETECREMEEFLEAMSAVPLARPD